MKTVIVTALLGLLGISVALAVMNGKVLKIQADTQNQAEDKDEIAAKILEERLEKARQMEEGIVKFIEEHGGTVPKARTQKYYPSTH